MIPSARPTVPSVAIITFKQRLFVLWYCEKSDVRTDNKCENNEHYRSGQWVGRPSGSIRRFQDLDFLFNASTGVMDIFPPSLFFPVRVKPYNNLLSFNLDLDIPFQTGEFHVH